MYAYCVIFSIQVCQKQLMLYKKKQGYHAPVPRHYKFHLVLISLPHQLHHPDWYYFSIDIYYMWDGIIHCNFSKWIFEYTAEGLYFFNPHMYFAALSFTILVLIQLMYENKRSFNNRKCKFGFCLLFLINYTYMYLCVFNNFLTKYTFYVTQSVF